MMPPTFLLPPPRIFRPSAIPVLHFCSFTYKFPKNLYFLNKASIAHLVERLTSDLTDPGSNPGGSNFFIKVRTSKLEQVTIL